MMSETMITKKNTQTTDNSTGNAFNIPPFISIVIINYSYGDLLGKALESCAAQTFQDFEIVMVNNGAIDNTEQVYQSFCEKHPEIRTTYVHIERHQGIMHGLNEAIKYARGEYVTYVDSDDWIEPTCLETLAEKARETGADRVTGQYQSVTPDGRVVRVRRFKERHSIPHGNRAGAIFRRSIILENEIVYPEGKLGKVIGEDHWFICRFARFQRAPGAIVPHVVYNYYMNPRSVSTVMSRNADPEQLDSEMRFFFTNVAEDVKMSNIEELKWEIEYLAIRITYARMLDKIRYLPREGANRFHDHTLAALNELLPNWRKNPFLWPFGNGYELFESICTYALVQLDRFHALWLIRLAEKISRLFKFRR